MFDVLWMDRIRSHQELKLRETITLVAIYRGIESFQVGALYLNFISALMHTFWGVNFSNHHPESRVSGASVLYVGTVGFSDQRQRPYPGWGVRCMDFVHPQYLLVFLKPQKDTAKKGEPLKWQRLPCVSFPTRRLSLKWSDPTKWASFSSACRCVRLRLIATLAHVNLRLGSLPQTKGYIKVIYFRGIYIYNTL